MKLKDLLRLAYNAGRDDVDGFDVWWADEGEERQSEFLDEQDADDDDGKGSE
jgi:hypothetical protein